MTDERFLEAWPEVERRLFRLVRALSIERNRGEDFIQEAALRVVREQVPYDSPDDLYRWAAVVVRRLVIDSWRRGRLLTDDSTLATAVSPVDVELEVERRLALEAVLRQWPHLTANARRAIVLAVEEQATELHEDATRAQRAAARYRARQALRRASNGLLAATGVVSLRRHWRATTAAFAPAIVLAALLIPSLDAAQGRREGEVPRAGARGATTFEPLPKPSTLPPRDRGPLRRSAGARRSPNASRSPTPQRLVQATPGGVEVVVESEPRGSGPLLCASPALPPLPESICTPRVSDVVPSASSTASPRH